MPELTSSPAARWARPPPPPSEGLGPRVRYLVDSEMEYLRRSYAEAGATGVARDWARKLREEFLWACRRNPGDEMGPRVQVDGGTLVVNPQDVGISKELLIYRTHEPAATARMKEFLSPGMTVIDVGANLGYYVLLERRLVGPAGKVIAVEPAPRNVQLLLRNIALNGLEGVVVLQAAVGDYDGRGHLFLSRKANWNSMLPIGAEAAGSVEVDVYRVDTIVDRMDLAHVDLIRMDLEGYETSVFRGMARTLERHRPKLVMELHPRHVETPELADLLDTLKDFGYQATYLLERQADVAWARRGPVRADVPRPSDEILARRLLEDGRVLTGFFSAPRNRM